MDTIPDQPAAQARAALEQADRTELSTDRDRRIHGLATAGFGVGMGLFVGAYRLVDGNAWAEGGLVALYVLVLFALAMWQKRAASTVPRNARRTGYVGLAASVAAMWASIIWLNIRQGDARRASLPDQVDSWWVYACAALVTALPMLAAGYVIQRHRR